jgi:hypothetical protein
MSCLLLHVFWCLFWVLQSSLPAEFTAVMLPNKDSAIVHISAGGNLSAAVDSDGLLIHWGCISEHQEFAVRQPSVMQVTCCNADVSRNCMGTNIFCLGHKRRAQSYHRIEQEAG